MRRLCFALVLVSTFLLSACASQTGPVRDVRYANNLALYKKYSEAVATYRAVIRDHPDSEVAAEARFALASTLAYYDNPQRDYTQALQEFDEFVRLYPNDPRVRDAQNWRHVLKTLLDLNRSIEQLKRLDIRHEERRKGR